MHSFWRYLHFYCFIYKQWILSHPNPCFNFHHYWRQENIIRLELYKALLSLKFKGNHNKTGISWRRHDVETFSTLLAFVRIIHRSTGYFSYRAGNAELWIFFILAWKTVKKSRRVAGSLRRTCGQWNVCVAQKQHMELSDMPQDKAGDSIITYCMMEKSKLEKEWFCTVNGGDMTDWLICQRIALNPFGKLGPVSI